MIGEHQMQWIYGLLISLCAGLGLIIGLIHVVFALTDPSPRNIWDWCVVMMGIGMCAMAYPAALHIASF
jgi:xanthosine utilization system XapX-like protein